MVQSLPKSDSFRILFNSPELSEVQRSGFHVFLKEGIAEELSKISCIQIQTVHFLVEILIDAQNFRLVAPENNYRDCILKMKSYTCKLYVKTKILFKDKISGELLYQTQPEWVLLADLPMMTKRGHFVINGSPRIVVHQVGRAPGIYFKKILKVKKEINNQARFYGDIIPRKGVWVRLQINKKGEIDLKLKKSKKVRAEMVQKCLELLEKSEWRNVEQGLNFGHRLPTIANISVSRFQNANKDCVSFSSFKQLKHIPSSRAFDKNIVMPNLRFGNELTKPSTAFAKSSIWQRHSLLFVTPHLTNPNKKSSFVLGFGRPLTQAAINSVFTQKRVLFNSQTSFLVGISRDDCFDSQMRQTRAFVIGLNHPASSHLCKWFSTNKKHSFLLYKRFHTTRFLSKPLLVSNYSIPFSSNQVIRLHFNLVIKKFLIHNGFASQLYTVPVFFNNSLKGEVEETINLSIKEKALIKNIFYFKGSKVTIDTSNNVNMCTASIRFSDNLNLNLDRNTLKPQPKQSFFHTGIVYETVSQLQDKRKIFVQDEQRGDKTDSRGNSVMSSLNMKKVFRGSGKLCLTKKRSFFYSEASYRNEVPADSLTKAEKEAFANVYTSFYKNEIKDLEERVSTVSNNVALVQRSPNKNIVFLPDKGSVTELKDKLSKKQKFYKKRRSAKKANTSNNLEKVREYLYQLFKKSDLYDLGPVGRQKINKKFGISITETQLTSLDIKEAINWLSKLRAGREEIDDIDHSQNRRVRTSSELIQTQFSIGITRLKNLVTKKIRNGKDELIKTSLYGGTKQNFLSTKVITLEPSFSQKLRFDKQSFVNKFERNKNVKELCSDNEVRCQIEDLAKVRSLATQKTTFFCKTTSFRQFGKTGSFFKTNSEGGLNKAKQNCEYRFKSFFGVPKIHLSILFTKSNFGLVEANLLVYMKSFIWQRQTIKPLKISFTEVASNKGWLQQNRVSLNWNVPSKSTRLHKLKDITWKQSRNKAETKNTFLFKRCLALLIKLINHSTCFNKLKYKSIKETKFNRLCFKIGSNCFVKYNKIIDYDSLHLENRATFTSINPYFVTCQEKKIYYPSQYKLKRTRSKLRTQPSASPGPLPNLRFGNEASFGFGLCKKFDFKDLVNEDSQFCLEGTHSYLNVKERANQNDAGFVPVKSILSGENNLLSTFSVSEWFSTKPINGALREFFSSSPLSQYMDQTNPLAEITHKRRISSLGIGGVSRESAGMTIRGIHPTHYGRICPIETPEGKNAGLVNSLAFYAKINDQGFIETPYYQVMKGQIQHELGFSFYSAGQETRNGLYIAPNDIKQSKSKLLATSTSTSIPVRVADNLLDLFKKVSPYQVNCIGISPVQILSVATSLIPFLEHNDANRALMGSNMQRQAVSLMTSERPIVGTGLEARVLAESGHLVQSKVSGFVSNVSAHQVVVQRLLRNHSVLDERLGCQSQSSYQNQVGCQIFDLAKVRSNKANLANSVATFVENSFEASLEPLFRYKPELHCQSETSYWNEVLYKKVPFLYLLQKETICAEIPQFQSLNATPMPNLRFGNEKNSGKKLRFIELKHELDKAESREPHNRRLVQGLKTTKSWPTTDDRGFALRTMNKNLLRLKQDKSFVMSCTKNLVFANTLLTKNKVVLFPVTHSVSTFIRSNQETCFTQKPLVKEGDWVQRGDMLSDCSAGEKGELSVGKNMLIAYIPWQGYNFEDAIVISDRLVKEQLYTSLHIERYTVVVNDFKDKVVDTNEWFTGNLPGVDSRKKAHLQKSGLPRIGTILKEGDILVGKIKYSKKKPVTPHEKLICDILGEHNFSVQNTSLYVPKGVHEARVLSYKIKTRFGEAEALKNNLRPAGAPKIVHLFLGEKRNIQVGDKMSGRHGNKGIVSTILPKQDMPYLGDGSPIDILLNPLGVPSRMNVGQVFECLLGLASTYLQQNFKVTAFDEIYGVEASQSLVFLKLYQARLQSGQNWLFQVNFPGKTRLTDGRSGDCLDQWITVGRAYILKLIHMVNEKIHARAIGPYALVTQQPLKGRAHKGGQRLGEMEVWAVEGFGAAYILQELLTKKSDDSVGRKEVLKAMLPKSTSLLDFLDPFSDIGDGLDSVSHPQSDISYRNEDLSKEKKNNKVRGSEAVTVLGQPDIFKVLICELQALCLDVGVYSIKTESFERQWGF